MATFHNVADDYTTINTGEEHNAVPEKKSNRALCCSLFTLIISIPALIGA
jgi:hypothetical protein